jgi:hypothetical protein
LVGPPTDVVGPDRVSALATANCLAVVGEDTGAVAKDGAASVVVLERRHG